jgi:PPOX class probable F420-dependent enzyme
MPGYGTSPAGEGTGLLPWSWATERLTRSHDYWVATVRPDCRPHVTPVWGVWMDGMVWFSSSRESSKARNVAGHPRVMVATDDAQEPVMVEGDAESVEGAGPIGAFVAALNAKYGTDYPVDFFLGNACFRVRPVWAFALTESDFAGSPTRWSFG